MGCVSEDLKIEDSTDFGFLRERERVQPVGCVYADDISYRLARSFAY